MSADLEPVDCGHVCCGRTDDPFHTHLDPPEDCTSCAGEDISVPDDDDYLTTAGLSHTHPYGTGAL